MVFNQDLLELENPFRGRGRHTRSGNGIERDQVDLGPCAGQQSDQVSCILVPIVGSFDEDIFKRNHAPVREGEIPAG